MKKNNVKLTGLVGTWYMVGEKIIRGEEHYIWESEIYGGEAPHSITDNKNRVLFTEEYNWFNDYEYAKFQCDNFKPYFKEYEEYLIKKENEENEK